MANANYALGRQKFLEGSIAYLSDNIKISLVTSGYTVNLTTDEFYGIAIAGGNIVAASSNLASKTSTNGTANAANVTWSSVSGSTGTQIVMWKDTGVANTSPLFFYIDTASNLPVTPNGGDIIVQWDTGTNKIFTLFEGLDESDHGLITGMRRWLKGVLGIPAEQDKNGLWIPQPALIQVPHGR